MSGISEPTELIKTVVILLNRRMTEQIYQCPECGLHYLDKALAKKCENFCKKNKACSLELAKHSTEAQAAAKNSTQ